MMLGELTGRPVLACLAGKDIALNILPLIVSSWIEWVHRHPETLVLSIDTGHRRDYMFKAVSITFHFSCMQFQWQ
jgi:hypothetical protein